MSEESIIKSRGDERIFGNVEIGDMEIGSDRMFKSGWNIGKSKVGVNDGIVEGIEVVGVEIRKEGNKVKNIRNMKWGKRIDMEKEKGMKGIEGMEEEGDEKVVRIGF